MGCLHAQRKLDPSVVVPPCAFCRTVAPSTEKEIVDQLNKGIERKDEYSIYQLASYYQYGTMGLQTDFAKALKLFLEAGKLGCADAYYNAGNIYKDGLGVKKDMKKAKHYWELGAVGGSLSARHNLGCFEGDAGNNERAHKHFLINAKAGHKPSLEPMKMEVKSGLVSKEKYAEALRLCQNQHEDTRSAMRDEALVYMANPSMYLNNS